MRRCFLKIRGAVPGLALWLSLSLLFPIAAWSQDVPDSSKSPRLQAELLKTLEGAHLRPGDEVLARSVTPLEIGGVKFAPGAIVKGRVVEAEPARIVLI